MLYEQVTGKLWDSGATTLLADCYSGFGPGKNNPDMQDKVGVGPIVQGWYTIGEPEYVEKSGPHGPYVLPLVPDSENEMLGRGGFLIHGDSLSHPGSASFGCIIPLTGLWSQDSQKRPLTGRALREGLYGLGDRRLQVVRSIDTETVS